MNKLRYADDITLMAESEEELLSEEPFDEFVGEKGFSPSYSSAILAPPLSRQS